MLTIDTPPGKHEADLCVAAHDAEVAGERHGDADADRVAVHGGDDGLGAVRDGDADLGAAVAVRLAPRVKLLLAGRRSRLCRRTGGSLVRGIVQVHARAKELVARVRTRKDNDLDARVRGQQAKGRHQRRHHGVGEGVVARRPVQEHLYDGRRHRRRGRVVL
jgi:hypothetical protein